MDNDARTNALRNRGQGKVKTSDKKEFFVQVIQSKCMGAESCVTVAPGVFSLDSRQLGLFRRGSAPLGVEKVPEGSIDSETVVLAAKSCPYKAIYVEDTGTGEVIAGEPEDRI